MRGRALLLLLRLLELILLRLQMHSRGKPDVGNSGGKVGGSRSPRVPSMITSIITMSITSIITIVIVEMDDISFKFIKI